MSLFVTETTKRFIADIPAIYFTIQSDNSIRIHCGANSTPCYDMEALVEEIENVIGKGSYLKKTKDGEYAKDGRDNIRGSIGFENDILKGYITTAAFNCCKEAGWDVKISPFFLQFHDIVD